LGVAGYWTHSFPPPAGSTAVLKAARQGHFACLQLLLDKGADPNRAFHGGGAERLTPLHVAVQNNHIRCVQLLLERGARINAATKRTTPPLILLLLFTWLGRGDHGTAHRVQGRQARVRQAADGERRAHQTREQAYRLLKRWGKVAHQFCMGRGRAADLGCSRNTSRGMPGMAVAERGRRERRPRRQPGKGKKTAY